MNDEKADPCVLIDLGGQQRQLEFTLHADIQIKRLTGTSIMQQTINTSDPEHLTILLWAGLLEHMPELDGKVMPDGTCDENVTKSLEQVSKWMTFGKLATVAKVLKQAFAQATPPETGKGKNEQSLNSPIAR